MKRYKSIFIEAKKEQDLITMNLILKKLQKDYSLSLAKAESKVRYDAEEQENVDFYKGKLVGLQHFQREIKTKIVELQKNTPVTNIELGIKAALLEIYKMMLD